MNRNTSTLHWIAAMILLAPLWAVWTVSASSAPAVPLRAWPPGPAPARLVLLQTIRGAADLGLKSSAWSRVGAWIAGRNAGVPLLERPFGLALDESGNLCLTDMDAGCVWYFELARGKCLRWHKIGEVTLQSPVAVAKRKDMFYVADSKLGVVLAFDAGGHLRRAITHSLARPAGLAASADRLYVADAQAHRVAVFDLTGGHLFDFGHRGTGPGEFNFPTHIAVAPNGQILVTDSMNCRVEVFDADGVFQSVIGGPGESSGYFSRPKGVAADSFGHIYVVDALFDNFQIFDGADQFLLDVGSSGAGPGEFCLPGGIAISADNHIYVADASNHRVQVFKYTGPP